MGITHVPVKSSLPSARSLGNESNDGETPGKLGLGNNSGVSGKLHVGMGNDGGASGKLV